MKTIKLFTISVVFFFGGLSASAQAVEQGTILIDAYYGFPNLFTTALKSSYAQSGSSENVKVGGIGPVGGKVEYLISDKFGISLDVNYTNTYVSYDEVSSSVIYNYKVSRSVLRAFPRFNFHFGNSDSFDGFAGVGAGYRTANWEFESTDPNYGDQSIETFIPVSFRIFVGGRYFFTDNLGLNMEFGLGGGALIQGGLSFKI